MVLGAACHVQTFRSPAADDAFAERRSCRCLAFQKHLPEPPKVKSEVRACPLPSWLFYYKELRCVTREGH